MERAEQKRVRFRRLRDLGGTAVVGALIVGAGSFLLEFDHRLLPAAIAALIFGVLWFVAMTVVFRNDPRYSGRGSGSAETVVNVDSATRGIALVSLLVGFAAFGLVLALTDIPAIVAALLFFAVQAIALVVIRRLR
jgi:cobalamin synthase